MSDKPQKIQVRDDVVFREEDAGAFVFDPDNGRLCHLNEIGIDIWKMCREAVAVDQIIRTLAATYPEASQEQIASDCASFLDELDRLGFLAT